MNFLILLCAGNSTRLNLEQKKQFLFINNKPIFLYSFEKFFLTKKIDKYIIVINKNDLNNEAIIFFKKKYKYLIENNTIVFVYGGMNRYDSVYNSLIYINNNFNHIENKKIIIHDSARPIIKQQDILKIIDLLSKYKSISLSSRCYETIKQIYENNDDIMYQVDKTLNRDKLFVIKTPQAFDFDLLYSSYIKFINSENSFNITDDIQIIELFSNEKSYLLDSYKYNIKITDEYDLKIIKYLLQGEV